MFRRLDKCDGSIFGETNIQDVNWVTYLRGHIFSGRGGGEGVYTGAYQRDFTVINIININI